MSKQSIYGLSLQELKLKLDNWGVPPFHASQIFSWLYKKKAASFDEMSDLSSNLRERLKQEFHFFSLEVIKHLKSKDNTEKFLFQLKDKNLIEAVVIPAEGRVTACISSQAGCKYGCRFCASGISGLKRDLSKGEIIQQIMMVSKNAKITHVVFMGTGEPLDNYDNVFAAIRLINDKNALNIGSRRITVSTSGLIPGIKRMAQEHMQIELSVSLHAADDKKRSSIMPVNNKYPLAQLIRTCRDYAKDTRRQVTFEYILIKGFNSSLQDAQNLAKIVKDVGLAKVNIIAANPVKEFHIEAPAKLEVMFFRDCLLKNKINVTLRRERGQDIDAACGQLRLKHEK